MPEEKKFGSVKRFGARYGSRLRAIVSEVEKRQKKAQKCPYCSKLSVKRIAAGIWQCNACGSKFTGAAYYLEEKAAAAPVEEKEKEIVLKSKKTVEEEAL